MFNNQKTSVHSLSHLKVRAGRRKKNGKGQGWGQSVTKKQLKTLRKERGK